MNIIQIGCNDCNDDVYKFIKNNQNLITKFIVVDALPKCIKIAKEKYSFLEERLIAINCAIGIQTEKINFYFPKGEETCRYSSLLKNHVKRYAQRPQIPQIEEILIDCIEVNEFLNQFSFNEIDLFALDIEGLDVDVLLKLDLDKFNINQIIYENYHSDGTYQIGKKNDELVSKLQNYKYDIQQLNKYNILAIKN